MAQPLELLEKYYGHREFRPGQEQMIQALLSLKIAGFVGGIPCRPLMGAYTATATDAVKADICHLLGLRDPFCLTTGFDRPNLFFDVQRPASPRRATTPGSRTGSGGGTRRILSTTGLGSWWRPTPSAWG